MSKDIKKEIKEDLKEALKASDKLAKDVLRGALDTIKKLEIDKKADATRKDAIKALRSQVKKVKESLEYYKKEEREELVEKAERELDILKSYLPEPLSEEELERKVEEKIEELEVSSMEKFGKLMGVLKEEIGDRVSGSKIAEKAKEILNKK